MEIKEIKISNIKVTENIRQQKVDENIAELMKNIKDYGLFQPIGVKENQQDYELIWGFRRLKAVTKLGWKTIPAVIFVTKDEVLTEEEFFIINASENLQRKQNSLLEFGRVCNILKKTMSNSEIAIKLGVPKSRVENALVEISRIPKKWQSRIRIMNGDKEKAGDIPLSTASKIGSIRSLSQAQKSDLLEEISKNDVNFIEIYYIASLVRSGMSLREAKKVMKDYKLIQPKLLINKNTLEKELKANDISEIEWVIKIFNDQFGKDFAIKPNLKHDMPKKQNEN